MMIGLRATKGSSNVFMMISGHKTRAVFERYNIVSDTDLREAAQRQEAYLRGRDGYKMVTISEFGKKEGFEQNAQTRNSRMPEVGIEPTRTRGPEDFESSASTSFTTPALY
jgi:hypothetical protein